MNLTFDSNGKFKILVLTDGHFGEFDRSDEKTANLISGLIDKVGPDLVILTGDMISGFAWNRISKDFFISNWKKFTDIFTEKNTYYAYVLGNHDRQGDFDNEAIKNLENSHPYSVFAGTTDIEPDSVSNYYIKIYSSFDNNDVSAVLWSLDTRDRGCYSSHISYGCLSLRQKEWYRKASQDINDEYGKNVSGFVFTHIPLNEYLQA